MEVGWVGGTLVGNQGGLEVSPPNLVVGLGSGNGGAGGKVVVMGMGKGNGGAGGRVEGLSMVVGGTLSGTMVGIEVAPPKAVAEWESGDGGVHSI